MIMDWREMAGRPTVRGIYGGERWTSYTQWAWSGGKKVGYGWKEDRWDGRTDPLRGWIIAGCWLLACSAEYVPPSSLLPLLSNEKEKTASIIYTP